MAIMCGRTALTAFLALTCLATYGASAQSVKKAVPADPIAVGLSGQEMQTSRTADEMSSQEIELIDKVSAYFNQMSSLKGEFVQTSAGGSRLRGKFYVKRPGRFRFDYARPSRLVIVSDGRYVAIQDHDLKTDDRWGSAPARCEFAQGRALLRRSGNGGHHYYRLRRQEPEGFGASEGVLGKETNA